GDPAPAGGVRDRRLRPVGRTPRGRTAARGLPRAGAARVQGRHHRPRRDRRQRRAVSRPRARGRADADAGMTSEGLETWNDTATRAAIVDFVERVTTEGGADFVPPSERIATFDNDGTLWCEKPMP